MKKIQRIYFILTYVFFILPPFIWGLVLIYKEGNRIEEHIVSLIINIIVYALITSVCGFLIYKKKLHLPDRQEQKYLIFGLVGNFVVYFYTFQNIMNIENIVTIYLVLLVVLIVHFFLISKKITVWELWFLLPIFLVVDYLQLLITGCGFTYSYMCTPNRDFDWIIYILHFIVVAAITAYYIYRIYLYKLKDVFKIFNVTAAFIIALTLQDFFDFNEDIISTIAIFMGFFTVVDIIQSIVNKTYNHKILFFYIRVYSLLMMYIMLGQEFEFFKGYVDYDLITLMVVFAYTSLFLVVFRSLLKIDVATDKRFKDKGIVLSSCTTAHKEQIEIDFGKKEAEHMVINSEAFSLVATVNNQIIGFVSTFIQRLPEPLKDETEAFINIIEVIPEYRKQGIATRFINKTEVHFRNKKIKQIRGWSSIDKTEALNLWVKLRYTLSPAKIYIKEKDIEIEGFYFNKKLS